MLGIKYFIMKKIFITLFLAAISISYSYSQCTIDIMSNSISVDTLEIWLGDSIDLYADANCDYILYDGFNSGSLGPEWDSISTNPMFTNPCPPIIPPAWGKVCWIGSTSYFPRQLTTISINLGIGTYTLEFDMKYGDQAIHMDCEDPDQPDAGVHLQFSVNGGVIWTDMNYWVPTTNITGPLYTWNHYQEMIQPVMLSTNTQFRWYQQDPPNPDVDHWGIDNVEISGDNMQIVNWSTGQTVSDPPPMYPTQTTDITCYVMNLSNGDFAIDSVHIIVKPNSSNRENITTDKVTIFPNPANKEVYISVNNGVIINEVNIYNQMGQKVLHKTRLNNKIDISSLKKGTYILEIVSNEFIKREKLIVE